MRLDNAIKMLMAIYEAAKQDEHIHKPLAYALYCVWKEADKEPWKRRRT